MARAEIHQSCDENEHVSLKLGNHSEVSNKSRSVHNLLQSFNASCFYTFHSLSSYFTHLLQQLELKIVGTAVRLRSLRRRWVLLNVREASGKKSSGRKWSSQTPLCWGFHLLLVVPVRFWVHKALISCLFFAGNRKTEIGRQRSCYRPCAVSFQLCSADGPSGSFAQCTLPLASASRVTFTPPTKHKKRRTALKPANFEQFRIPSVCLLFCFQDYSVVLSQLS